MSLTSLISAGRGPVWDWFAANLPETQKVCTAANRELRGGGTDKPCVVPPVAGTDHSLVGTAVGYLLSAHLRPDALEHTVATSAALLLDGPLSGADIAPSAIERLVVARIVALQPWSRSLGATTRWAELCRLVAVLARFEQYCRVGPVVLPHLTAPLQEHGESLDDLGFALINGPSMRDLEELGRVVVEDHGDLRRAQNLHIGPTFAKSLPLGGADADLIYDDTLVDLKSTSQARIVGRDEVWQLVGYLLADTDDVFRISRVGFAALRRRSTIYWSAEDLIGRLAGREVSPLPQLRAEFAVMLEPLGRAPDLTRRQSLRSLVRGH